MDPGVILLLYVLLSIVCGLILNIQNLPIFSQKSNGTSNATQRIKRDGDEYPSKRRNERNRSMSISSKKKPQEPKIAASTYVFSFSRIVFTISLILVFFSLIPSFYPVYKSLVAPLLPRWIQQFFSDIKTLLLTLFGYYLSGHSVDSIRDILSPDPSSMNTLKISLQDWIYSYILHCNLYHSALTLRWFCAQCTTPSLPTLLRLGITENMSLDCDVCLLNVEDFPNTHVSFFKDDGCSELMNDILHIVHNGASDYTSASTREILMDCFETFILYLRFSVHLLTRTGVRFLLSCSRMLRSVMRLLKDVVEDIVENAETNPSHSVALCCIVLLCFVITIVLLKVSLRFLKLFIDDIVSMVSGTHKPHNETKAELPKVGSMKKSKSSELELNSVPSHSSLSKPSSFERSPVWLMLDNEPSGKENGKSVTESWTTVLTQNEAIAQLMMQCNDTDEDVDYLLHLIEQLHTDKMVSDELMEAVRVVVASRLVSNVSPVFSRQQSNAAGNNAGAMNGETQSPLLFSPIPQGGGDYKRLRSSASFGRGVRVPFFRKQSMKGKNMVSRNSLGSDSTWSGAPGRSEKAMTEEEISDLL